MRFLENDINITSRLFVSNDNLFVFNFVSKCFQKRQICKFCIGFAATHRCTSKLAATKIALLLLVNVCVRFVCVVCMYMCVCNCVCVTVWVTVCLCV